VITRSFAEGFIRAARVARESGRPRGSARGNDLRSSLRWNGTVCIDQENVNTEAISELVDKTLKIKI
jgi:hypothetical protein